MMLLKAVVEPMLMRPSTMLKMDATKTARTGIELAGWTCESAVSSCIWRSMERPLGRLPC